MENSITEFSTEEKDFFIFKPLILLCISRLPLDPRMKIMEYLPSYINKSFAKTIKEIILFYNMQIGCKFNNGSIAIIDIHNNCVLNNNPIDFSYHHVILKNIIIFYKDGSTSFTVQKLRTDIYMEINENNLLQIIQKVQRKKEKNTRNNRSKKYQKRQNKKTFSNELPIQQDRNEIYGISKISPYEFCICLKGFIVIIDEIDMLQQLNKPNEHKSIASHFNLSPNIIDILMDRPIIKVMRLNLEFIGIIFQNFTFAMHNVITAKTWTITTEHKSNIKKILIIKNNKCISLTETGHLQLWCTEKGKKLCEWKDVTSVITDFDNNIIFADNYEVVSVSIDTLKQSCIMNIFELRGQDTEIISIFLIQNKELLFYTKKEITILNVDNSKCRKIFEITNDDTITCNIELYDNLLIFSTSKNIHFISEFYYIDNIYPTIKFP